jgi:hypothetical protein
MNRLERLIKEVRKQLFPYHHEHDIERDRERWEVGNGEYLASWLSEQIRNCRKKNRCAKRGRCAFYDYSDLSKRNYEICREVLLRIDNGDVVCILKDENGEQGSSIES